jgi:hypothetical protein
MKLLSESIQNNVKPTSRFKTSFHNYTYASNNLNNSNSKFSSQKN